MCSPRGLASVLSKAAWQQAAKLRLTCFTATVKQRVRDIFESVTSRQVFALHLGNCAILRACEYHCGELIFKKNNDGNKLTAQNDLRCMYIF